LSEQARLRANHIGDVMIVDRASAIAYKAGRHEAVARLPALGYCRADRDQRQVRAAYRRTR